MTVDEARKKMCPWIFMSYFMPGNIRGETPCNSCCQADHCMTWRWNYKRVDTEDELVFETVLSITDGYCGLAGKEGAE